VTILPPLKNYLGLYEHTFLACTLTVKNFHGLYKHFDALDENYHGLYKHSHELYVSYSYELEN
jgi:hypothetical protein